MVFNSHQQAAALCADLVWCNAKKCVDGGERGLVGATHSPCSHGIPLPLPLSFAGDGGGCGGSNGGMVVAVGVVMVVDVMVAVVTTHLGKYSFIA
jgi:hypothetical protein